MKVLSVFLLTLGAANMLVALFNRDPEPALLRAIAMGIFALYFRDMDNPK